MSEIRNLKPECIWRNFDALTQVPRPSGHLEKVQQFLLDFAAKAGVEAFKDEAENIVMRKPASPGMEDRKGIILQSHMDMVPQKNKDSKHNFETDPIITYVDGEWVKAKNTTLGADNGIGVATIMAVMEDKTLKHGPIEALITADEETGMYGANGLPAGELSGEILLNLDSETWGKFVIGSAGGIDVTAELEYKPVATDPEDAAVKITIKGLKGGHSGLEIHEGRANANKLMVRIVRDAIAECDSRLAEWHGGNMRNAIPFECEAILTLPKENIDALKDIIEEYRKIFHTEYRVIENDIIINIEEVETPKEEVPADIQDNLVDAIYCCHDGVIRMIPVFPTVVETSSNLAIINISKGKASIADLARSSSDSMKDYIAEMVASAFSMAGMKVELSGSYGGWDPNTDSEILKLLEKTYKQLFGSDAIEQVDHAGLECSIILAQYPNLDVVSLGPTIRSPHTTNERCLIETIEPFWLLLKKTLEDTPKKE